MSDFHVFADGAWCECGFGCISVGSRSWDGDTEEARFGLQETVPSAKPATVVKRRVVYCGF